MLDLVLDAYEVHGSIGRELSGMLLDSTTCGANTNMDHHCYDRCTGNIARSHWWYDVCTASILSNDHYMLIPHDPETHRSCLWIGDPQMLSVTY